MQQFDDGGIEIDNGENEKSPTKPLNEFPTQADDEPHLIFECSLCGVSAPADYFGPSPHFTKPISFAEDVYVMRDPFSARDKKIASNYLLLGAHCAQCSRMVCIDSATCSIYYSQRYCIHCAQANVQQFPEEIQKDVQKMQIKPT